MGMIRDLKYVTIPLAKDFITIVDFEVAQSLFHQWNSFIGMFTKTYEYYRYTEVDKKTFSKANYDYSLPNYKDYKSAMIHCKIINGNFQYEQVLKIQNVLDFITKISGIPGLLTLIVVMM